MTYTNQATLPYKPEEDVRRIRVLMLHPALAPYRVDLLNELAKHLDFKVLFLNENLLSQKFDQDYLRSLLKCEYGYITSGINLFTRQLRWGMRRAIKEFEPDVVIGPEYSPTMLSLALRKLLRDGRSWGLFVMTEDNVRMCRQIGQLRRAARRFVLNVADGMNVYTSSAKSWYVEYGIPAESISVCPNIHDDGGFRDLLVEACPVALNCVQEKNLLGKRVFLFVGRLAREKRIDRIVSAFAAATAADPNARLAIIGDGPEKGLLVELVESLGVGEKVMFLGRLEGRELIAWYLIGQTFVLASDFEPFGAVVNEALLAGMPALCSTLAGAADLIREGENGHIIAPCDVPTLAKLLSTQLSELSPLREEGIALKKNLMPITFKESVRDFVRAVKVVAEKGNVKERNPAARPRA